MAKGRSEDFKTPMCRLSYAFGLFKARAQEEGKRPQFGCTLIFPKVGEAMVILEKAVTEACEQEWPGKWRDMIASEIIRTPFLKGDGKQARNKESGELHPGMGPDVFFIRPNANEDRPPLVRFRSPNLQATEEEAYSGCYGKAVLNAYAWLSPQGGRGISFGIQMFQKLQEGERLGGGGPISADKWHEKIEDTGPAPQTGSQGAGSLFG